MGITRRQVPSQTNGFTLVEMLVVIAIISILAAMLLPTLQNAQSSATQLSSLNNLRQVGVCLDAYLNDGNFHLPTSTSNTEPAGTDDWVDWIYRLQGTGTIEDLRIFTCPADNRKIIKKVGTNNGVRSMSVGYGINGFYACPQVHSDGASRRANSTKKPTVTIFIADANSPNILGYNLSVRSRVANAGDSEWATKNYPDESLRRHPGGSAAIFGDYHAEMVSQSRALYGAKSNDYTGTTTSNFFYDGLKWPW